MQREKEIAYFDTYNLEELPELEAGKKYLEFLGGTKNYRCFIVDKNYSRNYFYKEHLDLIDEALHPVYKNRGIVVSHDSSFPVPGFYIISYEKQYKNIAELPESLVVRTASIIKTIRKIMIEKFRINYVNIYYEEKNTNSSNVHYWIVPKYKNFDIIENNYNNNIKNYLCSFSFNKTREKIISFNSILKKELEKMNYKKFDDLLFNKIEPMEKKINLCISNNCFMKCKGCYCSFSSKKEISNKSIINFLKYAKLNGLEKVTLSGGDPLARKNIKQIINECHKLKLKINLDTVGLPFIKSQVIQSTNKKIKKISKLKTLRKIDCIGIPLDGSNNDIISEFRIYKGNLFDEIIKVIEFFDSKNINICINTVIHKKNMDDIENIYNIIKNYKCIKKWQIFQFMPIGPMGRKNADLFEINLKSFNKVKNKIGKLNKNQNLIINFKSADERSYNYMLVNASGKAYKVDLNNKVEIFGQIEDKSSWDNILNNLF